MVMSPSLKLRTPLALAVLAAGQACKDETAVVVPPPIDAAFASLSAGLSHTCGVTISDRLYCWGWNRDGEIGDGSHSDRVYPVRVASALRFSAVSTGGGHSC